MISIVINIVGHNYAKKSVYFFLIFIILQYK